MHPQARDKRRGGPTEVPLSKKEDNPNRVRNAQALRIEQNYVRAREEGKPYEIIHELFRASQPKIPCDICGGRMFCKACDRQQLYKELLEEYRKPPLTYEIGIQADTLADAALVDDEGPSLEQQLAKELNEAKIQVDVLRTRNTRLSQQLGDKKEECHNLQEELQETQMTRDKFEKKFIKEQKKAEYHENITNTLEQKIKDTVKDYKKQLKQKDKERKAMAANYILKFNNLADWFEKEQNKNLQQHIVQDWSWRIQLDTIGKYEEMLEEAAQLLKRTIQEHEDATVALNKKRDDEQAAALAKLTAEFTQKLKNLQGVLDNTIKEAEDRENGLKAEIGDRESKIQPLYDEIAEHKASYEKLDGEHKSLQEAHAKLENDVTDMQMMLNGLQQQMQSMMSEGCEGTGEPVEGGSPGGGGGGGLDLKGIFANERRIKEMEEELARAEREQGFTADLLKRCEAKVMEIRIRLHNEIEYHLESEAKYQNVSHENRDLELKLVAQRRCIKRQQIKANAVELEATKFKHNKLLKEVSGLKARLYACQRLAQCSSEKDVRWAITQASVFNPGREGAGANVRPYGVGAMWSKCCQPPRLPSTTSDFRLNKQPPLVSIKDAVPKTKALMR